MRIRAHHPYGILPAVALVLALAQAAAAQAPRAVAAPDSATTESVRRFLGLAPNEPLKVARGIEYPDTRRPIQFRTIDGVILHATWGRTPVRPVAPAVILLPNVREGDRFLDRTALDGFGLFLLHNGYSVMQLDLRGFGESTVRADGESIRVQEFGRGDPEYVNTVRDIDAALKWILAEGRTGCQRHFVVGDRFGASVAGASLAKYGDRLASAVLIRPLNIYEGINLRNELRNIRGRPYMLVIPGSDTSSIDQLNHYRTINPDVRPFIVEGESGPRLYDRDDVRRAILKMLRETG